MAATTLASLAVEEWGAELQFSPVTATWLGDHRFDDRLDDSRAEALLREQTRLRAMRERVQLLSREVNPKDAGQQLDARLLLGHVDARILDLTDPAPHERNPLYYMNLLAYGVDGLLGPDFVPVEPVAVKLLARRLTQVPALCQEARGNLKNPPELLTRRAIEVGQATLEFLSTLLPRLVRGVTDIKALEEFRRANDDARRELEEFLGWMNRDLLPRSKGEWVLGRERLTARLRGTELLDVPLEQLQALGEKEAREVRKRLEEAARRILSSGGGGGGAAAGATGARLVAEAQKVVEEEHGRPEDLLSTAAEAVEGLFEAAREQALVTPPEGRPKVEEMPPYRWGYALLVMPGPLETRSWEPRFYIDPVDPAWKDKRRVQDHMQKLNRAQLTLSAMHEVMPGHYLQQMLLRQRRAGLTPVRQGIRSGAFVEGWASYAEGLLVDTVAAPERERLQFLLSRVQLLHLGRMVAALRLHGGAPGAPAVGRLDDATRYLMDECYLEDYAAHREAERAAYDPQVLLPALGRLQIEKLRRDYLAEQGERGSLRAFHDTLLHSGPLPLPALRELLLQSPGRSL